jgi:hypothetical protein
VEAEFALVARSDLKGGGLILYENTRMLKLSQAMGFVRVRSEEKLSNVFHVVKRLDDDAPNA